MNQHKVKFFQEGASSSTNLDGGDLEQKTNKWLKEHPNIRIKKIIPTSYDTRAICMIWYTDKVKK